MTSHRRRAAAWLITTGLVGAVTVSLAPAPASAVAATDQPAFSTTKVLTRTHLVGGKDVQVDTRTFGLTVDRTTGLRDRQGVEVRWTGAHPTGGIVFDDKKPHAADQEYPVVILQCRGVDTPTAGEEALSPETCFTGTPDTRYFPSYRGTFPPPRLDRYASPAERTKVVGAPNPEPKSCIVGNGYERFVAFRSASGASYFGGSFGCAGIAPEQTVVPNPLNPASATWARTLLDGTGSSRFIVQDDQNNASLGCSATVACSLVVVPVMGLSCDAAAVALPVADRPTGETAVQSEKDCETTGAYNAGSPNGDQKATDTLSKAAVNGRLWWSASNWRNHIAVPITFAKTAASCAITGGSTPLNIYGSQTIVQAVQQWAPSFCGDPKRFPLQQTETPEVQAKNLLLTGRTGGGYLGVQGIYQAGPPSQPFTNPVVQAPTALTGWGIGYVVDNRQQKQVTSLRLNARLLAKALTMSYPATVGIRNDWATASEWARYRPASHNPLNMAEDPEFKALNPELANLNNVPTWSATTLYSLASETDVLSSLTAWIDADPEAHAWLSGKPDPWGMEVNPSYTGIDLPVTSWPLLDKYISPVGACAGQNEPILPLVAGQVSSPNLLSFNLQYGISNSLVNCVQVGETANDVRRTAEGPEDPGTRFILGVVSLADAARFGISVADLQTRSTVTADAPFTDATGRTFAAADDAGMLAFARRMKADDAVGTWTFPYDALRTADGAGAYPGTLLVSTDVPTAGLDGPTASKFAQLLRFVAGPGQVRGPSNGQLAAGYVPLTSSGLGAFTAYTTTAAAAVSAQQAFVPAPTAPSAGPPATPAPLPTPTTPSRQTTGSGVTTPVVTIPVEPVTAPQPTAAAPSAPAPVVDLASTGHTAAAQIAWSNNVLPLLVVLMLVAGALGVWTGGLVPGLRR